MSSLRRRNVFVESDDHKVDNDDILKRFDGFSKIPDKCKNKSSAGGLVSFLAFGSMIALALAEIRYFLDPDIFYTYPVDDSHAEEFQIHVDITVAMKCMDVGMDIVDSTGNGIHQGSTVEKYNVNFQLQSSKLEEFKKQQEQHKWIQDNIYAIQGSLYKKNLNNGTPKFSIKLDNRERKALQYKDTADACRMVGTFLVGKIPGNLHIVPGQTFDVGGMAHMHIVDPQMKSDSFNYSHRINHFSFGPIIENQVNPLDFTEVITDKNFRSYKYNLQVVPTEIVSYENYLNVYQYAVTEYDRDAVGGLQSGIFFNYDIFPMKIRVEEESMSITFMIVRLAALTGGLFATFGFLEQLIFHIIPTVFCRRAMELPKSGSIPSTS